MSHINYVSSIHDGCTKENFNNINTVHRKAVRHLNNMGYREPLNDEHFQSLGILPLEKQYKLNKIILIHKIYNEKSPSYLFNLIKKNK